MRVSVCRTHDYKVHRGRNTDFFLAVHVRVVIDADASVCRCSWCSADHGWGALVVRLAVRVCMQSFRVRDLHSRAGQGLLCKQLQGCRDKAPTRRGISCEFRVQTLRAVVRSLDCLFICPFSRFVGSSLSSSTHTHIAVAFVQLTTSLIHNRNRLSPKAGESKCGNLSPGGSCKCAGVYIQVFQIPVNENNSNMGTAGIAGQANADDKSFACRSNKTQHFFLFPPVLARSPRAETLCTVSSPGRSRQRHCSRRFTAPSKRQ